MILLIAVGAVTVVTIAYSIGVILPQATPNDQVLARTTPDFRDFGIALFAGVAGAYGYYRKEFSAVLAGVAIAVALVPPLCVVGLMLEEGRYLLARNGLVLFLTNFAGITLAGVFVSFSLGAVRYKSLRDKPVVISLILTLAGCAATLIPLGFNYSRIVNPAAETAKYYSIVRQTLREDPQQITLESLKVDAALATIIVNASGGKVKDMDALKTNLQKALGLQVDLVDKNASPPAK